MIRATILLTAVALLTLTGVVSVLRHDSVEPYYLEYTVQHAVSGSMSACRRFYFGQRREDCRIVKPRGFFSTSSDGGWRVYNESDGSGNWKILRASVHGGPSDVVADLGAIPEFGPFAWSPNGRWLALSLGLELDNLAIYRLDMENGDFQQLLDVPHSKAWLSTWSADSQWLAYTLQDSDEQFRLFIMRADGSESQEVRPGLLDAFVPAWSPDGEWLVFQAECPNLGGFSCEADDSNLFRLRLADGHIETVVARSGDEYNATFSPDGEWIVYQFRVGNATSPQIYRMRPDGSEVQALTSDPDMFHRSPTWVTTPNHAWRPFFLLMPALLMLIFARWQKS